MPWPCSVGRTANMPTWTAAVAFALVGDRHRSQEAGLAVLGQQDLRGGMVDQLVDGGGVGALAVQQIGFGGPARPAGLTPVGAFNQGHDGQNIGPGRPAELHGSFLARVRPPVDQDSTLACSGH